ncbi:MAG TPA: lipopolysaccharide biosynthesis protein [Afifellaceae bacterium]|nr:lipopolysaccharide biosynthesis protein [Afifellaceae bacterium]
MKSQVPGVLNGAHIAADPAPVPEMADAALSPPEDRRSIARRIGRNVGIVVTGNAAVAGFGVITLALNARALGTAGLGVLALILTIATLVDRIAAFQTWQPLVKLGADALAAGDKRRVGQLLTVALLFDVIAAMAAAVAAVLIVLLAGERLGIPAEYLGVAAIYVATLVTRIADAPAGVMRLFDRFGLLTTLRAGEAAVQCLAAAILFTLSAPLGAYVLSFAGVAVATNVALLACVLHLGARAGVTPAVRCVGAAWAAEWRAFWAFSWTLNIASTINTVRQRSPVLLIGALLGPAAVGIYHVAERVVGVLVMAMWSFHQALYPEAARLATSRRRADLLWFVQRIGAICGGIGVSALLGAVTLGHIVVLVAGGGDYGQAYWPLVLLVASCSIALSGIGLHSVVLVTAGPGKVLKAHLLPFLVLVPVLPLATLQFGIAGAAGAHIVYEALWLAIMGTEFYRWRGRDRRFASDKGIDHVSA